VVIAFAFATLKTQLQMQLLLVELHHRLGPTADAAAAGRAA